MSDQAQCVLFVTRRVRKENRTARAASMSVSSSMPSVVTFFLYSVGGLCHPSIGWSAAPLVEGATRRSAGLRLHRKFTLHDMEAKRCHHCVQISSVARVSSTSWRCTRGTLQCGTPPKTHRQPTSPVEEMASCSSSTIFKKPDTLPRCPVESGSWWYAGSRIGFTIRPDVLLKDDGAVFPGRDCLRDGPLRQDHWLFSSTRHCEGAVTLALISTPLASWHGSAGDVLFQGGVRVLYS